MKPAPFAYRDPDTVDEVLALLAEHGDDAKLLAGGQSLGPMLNMRVVTPAVIVDLNRVRTLATRGLSAGASFALGALVRQAELEDDPGFAASQPLAAAALPWIAHRPIRNRGTVAGSLVHADPAAEWGGIVLALDARLLVRRAGAPPRAVAAEDFFTGILETAVEPEELLAEVRLPPWPEGARWGFREFARRRGDFALAGVACRFETDGGAGGAGRCGSASSGSATPRSGRGGRRRCSKARLRVRRHSRPPRRRPAARWSRSTTAMRRPDTAVTSWRCWSRTRSRTHGRGTAEPEHGTARIPGER